MRSFRAMEELSESVEADLAASVNDSRSTQSRSPGRRGEPCQTASQIPCRAGHAQPWARHGRRL